MARSGMNPLASSMRGRTGVAAWPLMLAGRSCWTGVLAARECPLLSVILGWDVAPVWPR